MLTNEKGGRSQSGQASSKGGSGKPEKASPAAVERYIKGIQFPAKKADLAKQAKNNHAPEDVLQVINRLPDQSYNTVIDITKALGSMK